MKQTTCPNHQMMPAHTSNQGRMFFAVATDLGITAEDIKERAKRKFQVDCFNKITKENMKWMLDVMNKTYNRKMFEKHKENI